MGVPSIIAILVILVLVVFSALTFTTSNADLALSRKAAESTLSFYEADSAAEQRLAAVVEVVRTSENWEEVLTSDGFTVTREESGRAIAWTETIDDVRVLSIEIFAADDGNILRRVWQVEPYGEWEPDDSIHLFQ